MKRWKLRAGAAGAACVLAGTAFASSASAHVHMSSPDAAGGGYGKLVFRVPNEEPRADTVALTLHLPFASVSTMQEPGWTVTTEERKLAEPVETDGLKLTKAVSTVTWRAEPGQGIPPGSFDEFQLSVGPLPKAGGILVVPAAQRYADGTTVNPTPAAAAAASDGGGGSDVLARVLGIVGVVAGLAAVAVAALTGRRRGQA